MKRVIALIMTLSVIMCGCSYNYGDVECYCCNKYILSDNAYTISDEYYCKDCYFSANECSLCDEKMIENMDFPYLDYCYDCVENKMSFCEYCGKADLSENIFETDSSILCASCVVKDLKYDYCNICYQPSIALSDFYVGGAKYHICNVCVTNYFLHIEAMKPCYYCIGCGGLTDNLTYIHSWTNEALCKDCVVDYEKCLSCGKYDNLLINGNCGLCGGF